MAGNYGVVWFAADGTMASIIVIARMTRNSTFRRVEGDNSPPKCSKSFVSLENS
jgi:hypothetical protein